MKTWGKLTESETSLFSLAIDGNNLAKQLKAAASANNHVFKSDYFLSHSDVDIFENEVCHHSQPQTKQTSQSHGYDLDEESFKFIIH